MKKFDFYSLIAICAALLFLAGAHFQSNLAYSILHLIAVLNIGFCFFLFLKSEAEIVIKETEIKP
jgi:hypothetical protein